MISRMRNTFILLILTAAIFTIQAGEKDKMAKAAPAVIAVKFHADWCGSCKAMDGVFEEMQAKFDTKPVLYVTLDHTREFNRKQSKFMAQSLGLDDVWAKHGGKTGFILLIDGKTREVITTLKSTQNLKQMGAELAAAVDKVTAG